MGSRKIKKGFSSEFPVVYLDRYTPDDGRRTQRQKREDNNNKSEVNSVKKYKKNKKSFFPLDLLYIYCKYPYSVTI